MLETATIIIPDISGYTEFLTKTELEHSSHIINELLELLVDSNNIELTLAEVEGDALLFYRKGKPIELEALIRQAIAMFENFHKQLRIIERDSICPCGACQTVSDLGLKFITHYGTIKELMVSRFTKASGVDMVVAHRLLKNRINSNEYILVTQGYLDNLSDYQFPSSLTWQHSSEEYPAIGRIEYKYALLEDIKNRIPPVSRRSEPVIELGDNRLEVEIEVSLLDVYRELIDIDRRSNWFTGCKVMEREDVTERIGLKHMCLFQGTMFEIAIAESQVKDSEIIYVEDMKMVESGTRFRHTYILRHVSDLKTLLTFDLKQIDGTELTQEMSSNLLMVLKGNLETLKRLCEN
jgi:Protein of unknown function (DUF2652)